jgi:hypothetical protein
VLWLLGLWRACWKVSGTINFRDIRAECETRLQLTTRLLYVLEEGPSLPDPHARLARALRRWRRRDLATLAAVPTPPPRGRGRETRFGLFVRLMLERDPTLPRSPGAWLRFSDEAGPVEPAELDRGQLRNLWRMALRAKRTRAGTRS